jgi:acyl carrier protein
MTAENRSGIERMLRRFIVEELTDGLHDGGDPLASGAVDSLGLEQLAEYIEQEFGVELRDEEMVVENFESLPVLAALVDSKRTGATL